MSQGRRLTYFGWSNWRVGDFLVGMLGGSVMATAGSVVIIDSVRNDDWIRAMPGYKNDAEIMRLALVELDKEEGKESKHIFCVRLGSKSAS